MRKMKDSGVEWIGEIPEEWRISKIKNGYTVTLGKMLSTNQSSPDETLENYLCASNIKFSGVDMSENRQMWFSPKEKDMYLLEDGDVLVMEGGTSGTSCVYHSEFSSCYIQNSVNRLRGINGNLNKFGYYWMWVVFYSGMIGVICNRATITHYTKEKLQNTPLVLCDREDQRRIVSYLDSKCSQIDSIIEGQKSIIEKLKEYKQSVITEAVTKGLNPDVEMKDSGIEWIGEIPRHWITAKVRHFAQFKNGDRSSNYPSGDDIVDEGVPFLTSANLNELHLNVNIERGKFITEEHYSKLRGAKLKFNDIIFCLRGSVGKCSINKNINEGTIASSLVVIRPVDIFPDFLNYVLNTTATCAQAVLLAIGVASQNLAAENIAEVIICVPPLIEQRQIADYLDKKTAAIDTTIATRESFITKLTEYKKSLIYEVVTGKKEV